MKRDTELMFKSYVLRSEKYRPKAISFAEQHREHLRLMANESVFGPSPEVREAMLEQLESLHQYPDPTYLQLREEISKYSSTQAESIIVGNGSMELIDMVYRGFVAPGDEVILSVPTYGPYEQRLQVSGGEARYVPMLRPDFRWNTEGITNALNPRTKMIVIVSPNNPVGNLISREQMTEILDTGAITVVDEAYYEYAQETVAPLANKYENLIILRTFSKAFGLAGLRVGYAITSPKLVSYLEHIELTFHINNLAVKAAIAALSDLDYLGVVVNQTILERQRLVKELETIKGLKPYPSRASFILVQVTSEEYSASQVIGALREKNILIRDVTGRRGLEGNFIRITVGRRKDNEKVVGVLKNMATRRPPA